MIRGLALAACLLAGLSACTVGPDFLRPKAEAPPSWHDAAAKAATDGVTMATDPDPRWWTAFHDPLLDSLIDRAIAGNIDLRKAVYRIAEARLGEVQAAAAGLPSLSANAKYTRQQLGLKGLLEENHADQMASQSPQAGAILNQITQPIGLYQTGLDASWELDLFGRVRRSVEQSEAQTEASIEDRNSALVALEAEVATNYARLRGAQADAAIAQDNIRIEQELLDLARMRAQGGLTTDLDVQRAAAQLAATRSELPQYERAATRAINALSLLLGQIPGSLDSELATAQPLPPLPPQVPIGLPASLARRRPDIRAAEARLHAETAGIGIAVAQLFPDISLTGQVGTRATQPQDLTHWANLFYSFGPSISLPIFQGGKLVAGVRLAKAEQASAALDYQKAVLTALQEVENALTAGRTEEQRRRSLAESAADNERALALARDRYTHGLSTFIDVLTAESSLVQTREQLTQSTLTSVTNLVTLYKALGGGWQTMAVSEAPPETK